MEGNILASHRKVNLNEVATSINRHCEEPKATRQSRQPHVSATFWIAALRSQ
jgi:hypothetical protein